MHGIFKIRYGIRETFFTKFHVHGHIQVTDLAAGIVLDTSGRHDYHIRTSEARICKTSKTAVSEVVFLRG